MSNQELDVIDFVVKKGNGVKSLSDLCLTSVPPQYVVPVHERLVEQPSTSNGRLAIPIIDVSDWDTVEEQICHAAREWGFFQIINHGIPIEVLDDVLNAGHFFFGLPVEEKKEYFFRKADSDETCRLATSFSPHKEKVLEWKDYLLHIYSIEEGKDQPKGFLSWPPVSRNQVLEYMKCVKPVINKLLQVLMKGLNVDKIDEDTVKTLMETLNVLLMYYPKCPNPDLTSGAGPHADVSTITVLLQDDIGGLYVRGKEENSWIPVEPVKGALVINIGDVLQIKSNDRYHSVEHRVSTNSRKHRISVPLFVQPAPDSVVETLNQVLEIGEKPLYKPIILSDYLKYFFSKPHDGKQTIEYAKI